MSNNNNVDNSPRYIYVKESNTIGKAGFWINMFALIMGAIGLVFPPLLIFGLILWLLGSLCSFIGLFKRPRGMAIVGIILALLGAIPLLIAGGLVALFSAA